MPFPNEHSARIKPPIPSNASVTKRKMIAPGISVIIQRNKGDDEKSVFTQSYRFSKRRFTTEQAKGWLKQHNISPVSFHPAEDSESKEDRGEMMDRIAKEIGEEII